MYKIKQHLPSFFDPRDSREKASVESLEEMLNLPWVSSWKTHGFNKFSQSSNSVLMAEMKDGTSWVVASIPKELAKQLPRWKND